VVTGVSAIPLRVTIVPVAPGLFNPGAQIIRVRSDGSQSVETVTGAPIAIGSDTVYLVQYGTGFRGRSSLDAVSCVIGTFQRPVVYAGPQTQYAGLDQVNVLLPASLNGAGKVNFTLRVDGRTSNAVPLTFQ
jgi:uncharacterized protein (TIGR03437 family)